MPARHGAPMPPRTPAGSIRDLHRTMALADDARIAEIVTLVDSLPERGAADALLVPLRGRLLQIRPTRRTSFTRLLFTPANAVVVAAAQWRRTGVTLPRTGLCCLVKQVRAQLGPVAAEFDARLADATTEDRVIILREGQLLWCLAADVLRSAGMPDDWVRETGLAAADYTSVARGLAALLHVASRIEAFADRVGAGCGVPRAQIQACLAEAVAWSSDAPGGRGIKDAPGGTGIKDAPGGAAAIGMLVGVLLARLPRPEDILIAADDVGHAAGDPSVRQACDLAIDGVLAGGLAHAQDNDIGAATRELAHLAGLLDALEKPGPACRPARKSAVMALRRETDAACRQRFETDMAHCIAAALDLFDGGTPGGEAMLLEATMRDLRKFEAVARRFGGGPGYDRGLSDAATALARPFLSAAAPSGAIACNVARSIEILAGPEAGLAFLTSQPGL